ncbi:hypothetical protein WG915_03270 [Corynebacterium sp. H128]|uniref:hypothetical protein n=1 Tax=unclassified Corynebacterium TaxID=2624378 RepID=UPI00309799CB
MKLETFHKQQEQNSRMLRGWRTQKRRRLLVSGFLVLAALTAISALLIPASPKYLLAIVSGFGALAILWTIIRITIDSEDMAPLAALDEYQFARLEAYRAFAFKLYGFFASLIAFILIFGSMMWDSIAADSWSPTRVGVSLGYLLLLVTLTVGGYPALALAWNKSDED